MKTPNSVTQLQSEKIREVSHLKNGGYKGIVPENAIEYFTKRYINPLKSHIDISSSFIVDCGCGYGWLCFAYILNGGNKAIAVDADLARLNAAKEIAKILGIDDKIEFKHESLTNLSLKDNEVEIFACIETLEHLENKESALREISRVASELIMISTPNKWFPIDRHDTGLPFAHWLPQNLRTAYAKMFNRLDHDHGNKFLSHRVIESNLKDFKLITPVYIYKDIKEFKSIFPHYKPYGKSANLYVSQPNAIKMVPIRVIFKIGKSTRYFLPNVCGIYKRVR